MFKIISNPDLFVQWKNSVSQGTKLGQQNSSKFTLQQLQNKIRMKENNPNQMHIPEVRQKLSDTQKKRYEQNPNLKLKGELNPMYGRSAFHEQSEEWQIEQRKQRSQKRLQEVYLCPICQKTIRTTANFYRHCRRIHNQTDDEINALKTKYRDSVSLPSKLKYPMVSNIP